MTYLGCTIRQVAVKSFGRTKIILFSKSEIDKNRGIVTREEDVSRPEGQSVEYYVNLNLNYEQDGVYVLDIVVHNTPGV